MENEKDSQETKKKETDEKRSSTGKEGSGKPQDVVWTREMRCTEVMLPKEMAVEAPSHPPVKDKTILGRLLADEHFTDEDNSKSLTSFADKTWKPDPRNLDTAPLRKQIAVKNIIRTAHKQSSDTTDIGENKEHSPKEETNAVIPEKKLSIKPIFETRSTIYTNVKPKLEDLPKTPVKQSAKMALTKSSIYGPTQAQARLEGIPYVSTKDVEVINLDVPMSLDPYTFCDRAKKSAPGQQYMLNKISGYHETAAHRTIFSHQETVMDGEVQVLQPLQMIIPQWQRKQPQYVQCNDLTEVFRARAKRCCNERGMNAWMRRLLLDALDIDDPEQLEEGPEEIEAEEETKHQQYLRNDKDEAIKDGIRAMLFAFDLTLNLVELLMCENSSTSSETYRSLLQQFIHNLLVSFLQRGTMKRLNELAQARGNNEQLITFLLARLFEWVDLANEKLRSIPEKMPLLRDENFKSIMDSKNQTENYCNYFLPRALVANKFYARMLKSYSLAPNKATIAQNSSVKTPFWIADEIRAVSQAYNIGNNDQTKANIPFLKSINKAVSTQPPTKDLLVAKEDYVSTSGSLEGAEEGNLQENGEMLSIASGMKCAKEVGKKKQLNDESTSSKVRTPVPIKKPFIKKLLEPSAKSETVSASRMHQTKSTTPNSEAPLASLRDPYASLMGSPAEERKTMKTIPSRWKVDESAHTMQFGSSGKKGFLLSEEGSRDDPDELIQWATETMKKFDELKQIPREQQPVQREKFVFEQGASLKYCRDKWRTRMARVENIVNGNDPHDEFTQIERGVKEKVVLRKAPPADGDTYQMQSEKSEQVSVAKGEGGLGNFLWTFFSKLSKSKADSKTQADMPTRNKLVFNDPPIDDTKYNASRLKQIEKTEKPKETKKVDLPKMAPPTNEEIRQFIIHLTEGLENYERYMPPDKGFPRMGRK